MQSSTYGLRVSRRSLVLCLGALVLISIGVYAAQLGLTARRQADVAARGVQVMPFDLDRSLHVFAPLDDGGRQSVTVKYASDAAEIALIRAHLQEEADKFRRGDFSDPAAIHGDAMPGLAELRAGASRIDIRYSELPDGAELRYTTDDPALVQALHHWFEAQVSDHGRHARHQ